MKEKKSGPPTRASIIPCLSGMRGVAALMVIYLHQNGFDHAQTNMGGWDTFHEFGHIAVIFFFVLSAFLLTYRGLYDVKRESDVKYLTIGKYKVPVISLRWIAYFIRRLFRIYPCYILTVVLATTLPRFQGDNIQGPNAPYYINFNTNKAIPPKDILNYAFLNNVQSIFWTIPPEIEYYFVLPFIIVLFELAQKLDYSVFNNHDTSQTEENELPQSPSGFGATLAFNLQHSIFRTIHVVFFSCLSLPNVVDRNWYLLKTNQNHLPPHYFRFWTGSFIAIILYLLEQNNLVPKIPTLEELASKDWNAKFNRWGKKFMFLICDVGCWFILIKIWLGFPWYQGNYFGVKIPTDPNWPASWTHNTSYIFFHGNVFSSDWYTFSDSRSCAYVCGLVIFLICYGGKEGTFSKYFQWSFFMYAGEVSFPIYLTHFIGIREYRRLWQDYVSSTAPMLIDNVILAVVASIIVATIMHIVVEKPCMKLGSWIIRMLRSKVFVPKPDTLKLVEEKLLNIQIQIEGQKGSKDSHDKVEEIQAPRKGKEPYDVCVVPNADGKWK